MSFRRALPGVKARLSAAIGPLNQSVTGPLSQLTEFEDADNLLRWNASASAVERLDAPAEAG